MLDCDLHMHTLASNCGNHTILEMMERARAVGLKAMAITDHGELLRVQKFSTTFFKRFENPYDDIILFKGMEANTTEEGFLDIPACILEDLDIVLLGLHYNIDSGKTANEYTDILLRSIELNPCIDCITHPYEKEYPLDLEKLAAACAPKGIALELNNSKIYQGKFSGEQAKNFLDICKKHQCSITINSDAHVVTEVGYVKEALALIESTNFPTDLIANYTLQKTQRFLDQRRQNKKVEKNKLL